MREGVLTLNARYRDLLSNDLGTIAGLLFDIGSGRYPAPPLEDSSSATITVSAFYYWIKHNNNVSERASPAAVKDVGILHHFFKLHFPALFLACPDST